MGINAIYDPQIRINNETFSIVPSSARIVPGQGESSLRPQSAGNGAVDMVYSEDVETKIAKVLVSVYSTKEKFNKVLELKANKSNNYIAVNDVDLNIILKDATLITDPEFALSNDGQAELEFHGRSIPV